MRFRQKLGFAALLGLCGLLYGCNQTQSSGPPLATPTLPAGSGTAAKDKGTIGVSLLTLGNPFFKVMGDAMTSEGEKHGYKVIITAGEMDPARQKDQVKDFIVKKVSAIVLCPCDSRSIGTTIQEANKAGIPVFTADIACLDKSASVVCHIATDNYEGGKQAGKAMVDALGGRGNVAIINHPEVESVMLRTKGFREVVAGAKGIHIVADLPGGAAQDPSYKTAQDILQKNTDLAGIFCINDPTAYGAVAAIEKAGRQGKIKVISFDGQPQAKQLIRQGKIVAEPVQYPDKIGTMTVQTIEKYMAGEKPPAQILIPPTLYTKVDADKDLLLKP